MEGILRRAYWQLPGRTCPLVASPTTSQLTSNMSIERKLEQLLW